MPIEVSQAQLPSLILLFVLLVSVLIAIYLGLKSGDKYSVEDAQSDAVSFAGTDTNSCCRSSFEFVSVRCKRPLYCPFSLLTIF